MGEICADFPRFTAAVRGPAFFGNRVVYRGIASEALEQLHRRLVAALAPRPESVQRYFEGDDYVPHLTLAQNGPGHDLSGS